MKNIAVLIVLDAVCCSDVFGGVDDSAYKAAGPVCCSNVFGGVDDSAYKAWKSKMSNIPVATVKPASAAAASAHGISLAMDSRLENGIELCAELRLKVSVLSFSACLLTLFISVAILVNLF